MPPDNERLLVFCFARHLRLRRSRQPLRAEFEDEKRIVAWIDARRSCKRRDGQLFLRLDSRLNARRSSGVNIGKSRVCRQCWALPWRLFMAAGIPTPRVNRITLAGSYLVEK